MRPWIALIICCYVTLIIGRPQVSAHTDPRGEAHPSVIAYPDRFEVYFENNLEWENSKAAMYRSVFKLDGTSISQRERYDGEVPATEGFVMMLINGSDGVPTWETIGLEGGTEEDPRFGGEPKNYRFLVPRNCNEDCRILAWPSRSSIVLRFSPSKSEADNNWPFYLGVFDTRSGKVESMARIGQAGRIFAYAVTSQVAAYSGSYYIAWMETKVAERKLGPGTDGSSVETVSYADRVILSRWNPVDGSVAHFELSRAISHNAALSLAIQGDQIMVAWHDFGIVRTRAVNLRTAPFTRDLPPLADAPEIEGALMREAQNFLRK